MEQDPTYLEPMRDELGQDVLDVIEAAGWVLVTDKDFQLLQDAYVLQEIRSGRLSRDEH